MRRWKLALIGACLLVGCSQEPTGQIGQPTMASGPQAPATPPYSAAAIPLVPVGPGRLDGSSETAFKQSMRIVGDRLNTVNRLKLIVALKELVEAKHPELHGKMGEPAFDQRMREVAHGKSPDELFAEAKRVLEGGNAATIPSNSSLPISQPGPAPIAEAAKSPRPPALAPINSTREVYVRDLPLEADVLTSLEHKLIRDFTVQGVIFQHGLYAHPPDRGKPSRIAVRLANAYQRLRGGAGQSDGQPTQSRTPIMLKIVGDGQQLWASGAIRDHGNWSPFEVDVSNVDHLELIVECPGDHSWAWAVWIDPVLTRK